MCIPPINQIILRVHYQIIIELFEKSLDLGRPSIGMSGDYLCALNFDPKYIRLGTVLVWKKKMKKCTIY